MVRNRPTLEEIASVAGVSRSTVSRVINDAPNVSDAVRQRVKRIICEMGYYPNVAARRLAGQRSQTLAVVIPETINTVFIDPFFHNVLRGIAEVSNAHHYHMLLSLVDRSNEEDFYRRALHSQMLDGVVIVSALMDDPLISYLLRDRIPFVLIGRHDDPRVSYVDADNVGGARMATTHLLQSGRRRIATITGPLDMVPGLDRRAGYQTALLKAGYPVDEALIVEGDFTEASGRAAMEQLLPLAPDAVFIASDLMALGALSTLWEAGCCVPDDVAVIGFDDAPVAAYTDPPLTTVRQPVADLGRTAARMLLRLLQEEQKGLLRQTLATELIVRASCGHHFLTAA